MLLKPFSVAALVAASATSNAFLIPPQLSELDIEVAEIVPLSEAPENVIVELDCPGCPVGLKNGAAEKYALLNPPPQNFLHFLFAIDHEGSDRLLVNGLELYPAAKAFPGLYAMQVFDVKREKAHLARKLGYSLQVQPVAKDNDGGLELIQLDLQIIELSDVFVKDIPNIRVKLIKGDGKLMIGGIETTASQSPHTEGDQDGECTTLMCKWIAYAQEKFKQMKNHVKPKPCNKNGMNKGWRYGHGGHHGGPAHGHHGHDNYNQRPAHSAEETNPHSAVKLFKNIFSHILFPVVIGVVAGVSVSLIGMVIGTLAVSMWRAVFRRGTGPCYSAVATKEDEEAPGDEEKSGLMEHQDPPPAYEHPEDVKKTDV